MSTPEPTEEEMRAALEAEMARISVDEILIQSVVSLINLGGRRLGLHPGGESEQDLDQARLAIEAVRALGPVLEARHPGDANAIRDALAQLQMGYAQAAGSAGPAGGEPAGGGPGGAGGPGTGGSGPGAGGTGPGAGAQRPAPTSPGGGRLWIPGQ